MKIWLVIYNINSKKQFTKYFDTEYEKDKYKRKIKHISNLLIVEDSTDIMFGNED